MIGSGYYAMARGWMDHPLLVTSQPLTRREAWAWLIEHAAWRPHRQNIAGQIVYLDRGQLTASLRYLAKAWGWSVASVRRFVTRLETGTMIGTQTGTGQLVVTICNYDKYQATPETPGTESGTPTGTEAAQERHKEEEGKERKEDSPSSKGETPVDLKTEIYRFGKTFLGNKSGGQVTNLIKRHGGDFTATMATLQLAAKKADPAEYVGAILKGAREPETDWDAEYRRMGVLL